jgi:hypothetical protein
MHSSGFGPASPVLGDFEEISGQFHFFELDGEMAGRLNRNAPDPHRHAYHEIVWVRQGSASHLLDGEELEFPTLTVLMIPKGRFPPGKSYLFIGQKKSCIIFSSMVRSEGKTHKKKGDK